MKVDITKDALGTDAEGKPVYLQDIWPTEAEVNDVVASAIGQDMFTESYSDVFAGDAQWQALSIPTGNTFEWDPQSTYVRKPPYFDGMGTEPEAVTDISGARVLAKLGDSVTTDHISPAGAIKADSPAGKYLTEHGVERRDFNSYGSRRGNHEVMIRGTFANIRLRNQIAPGTEGGFTRDFTQVADAAAAPVTSIYDASRNYIEQGIPLVVLAGKEYGSGSSRDWAAKGTALLGVKAVIAESYERIHRSNLIGMGVLPLQFPEGDSALTLGLTGEETFSFTGVTALNDGGVRGPSRSPPTPVWSSTRSCASTPPARRTTTATAASCSTCSGRCCASDRPVKGVRRARHRRSDRAASPPSAGCGPCPCVRPHTSSANTSLLEHTAAEVPLTSEYNFRPIAGQSGVPRFGQVSTRESLPSKPAMDLALPEPSGLYLSRSKEPAQQRGRGGGNGGPKNPALR